nr:MAG TPA: hypothetical protein [Caudoviricetes sp.]
MCSKKGIIKDINISIYSILYLIIPIKSRLHQSNISANKSLIVYLILLLNLIRFLSFLLLFRKKVFSGND